MEEFDQGEGVKRRRVRRDSGAKNIAPQLFGLNAEHPRGMIKSMAVVLRNSTVIQVRPFEPRPNREDAQSTLVAQFD